MTITTAAFLGLMLKSRSPLRTSEHISVVLVILSATMVQRIHFGHVAVCLFSGALCGSALASSTASWRRCSAAIR